MKLERAIPLGQLGRRRREPVAEPRRVREPRRSELLAGREPDPSDKRFRCATPTGEAVIPPVPSTWSPPARLGRHLRLQARDGFRAAVIELRPGLFLVAEVPDRAARAEFGFIPLLAPLMVRAATRAIAQHPPRPGLLAQAQQAAAPTPAAEPDAALVPAPRVAPWAEDEDVAGLIVPLGG